MSYSQNDRYTGGQILSTGTETAGTTATVLLLAAAAGQCNRIWSITLSAIAATVMNVKVTKNDGTTVLAQWDWAGTANSLQPTVLNFTHGLCCAPAEASKVIITNTGSGAIVASVTYDNWPS